VIRHGLRAAVHVDAGELRVDQLPFVELRLDPIPVRVGALVRAGDRVEADDLPRFGEAFVLSGRPLDAWLAGPGSALPLLPLAHRRRRLLLLLFLVGVLLVLLDELLLGAHIGGLVDLLVESRGRGCRSRAARDDVIHVGVRRLLVAVLRRRGLRVEQGTTTQSRRRRRRRRGGGVVRGVLDAGERGRRRALPVREEGVGVEPTVDVTVAIARGRRAPPRRGRRREAGR
jgi:hypothetical protein